MTKRVAILTPDQDGAWYSSRWPDVFKRMAAALEAQGMTVEDRSWTGSRDLDSFDLILPLLVWGYHRDGDWQAKVATWEAAALPLYNAPAVLSWNADKAYLGKLAEAGAPVTPTVFVEEVRVAELEDTAAKFGVEQLVVKPRISAGAFQTIRWSPGQPLDGAPDGAAMIQPYLPFIETEGEVSLIYLGGQFSHAISKRPQPGDFRVQPEFDGIIAPHQPADDELSAAESALKAAGEDLLYARVDLVRDLGGVPVLMELELVEPDLYLAYDEDAPTRFAQACATKAAA